MVDWTPPSDAIEVPSTWTPPSDAVEVPSYEPSAAAFNPTTRLRRQGATPLLNNGIVANIFGGVLEPLAKMGTSIVAKPVSDIAGLLGVTYGLGTGDTSVNPTEIKHKVEQALTYQPQTAAGASSYNALNRIPEAIGGVISRGAQSTGNLVGGGAAPDTLRGALGNAVQEAVPQALAIGGMYKAPVNPSIAAVDAMNAKVGALPTTTAAQQFAKGYGSADDAARIEAANLAKKYGISVDPLESNPSRFNAFVNALTGKTNVGNVLSKKNVDEWSRLAREDLGVDQSVPLHKGEAFSKAKDQYSGSYREIGKLGTLTEGIDDISSGLSKISTDDLIVNRGAVADAIQLKVNAAIEKVKSGMTGEQALQEIKSLRDASRSIYKGKSVSTEGMGLADAYTAMANQLENLIGQNIVDPTLLSRFNTDRTGLAKTRVWENATDFNTGRVDVSKIASQTAGKSYFTGILGDVGTIAGNFPSVAKTAPGSWKDTLTTHLARTGPAAGVGYSIGGIPGAIVGSAAGELGGMWLGKKIATPEWQAAHAIPTPRMAPVQLAATGMRPATLPERGSTDIVPYDYSQSVVGPETGMGRGQAAPIFGAERPNPNAPRALPNEVPQQIQKAEYWSKTAAEMRQAAEEAASRKPTSGGMLFDLDPITGKLRAADQGVKGATPEVWQANTGVNLKSASEKVASGQQFNMTAAEKVAWNQTKVDLAKSVPELKGLSDAQIASKMADRQFVQGVIDKTRNEMATQGRMEAFLADQLSNRTNYRMMAHEIATKTDQLARIQAERARMAAMVEQLQETLQSARPVRGTAQGPKTRAHQRGLLTGENQ